MLQKNLKDKDMLLKKLKDKDMLLKDSDLRKKLDSINYRRKLDTSKRDSREKD
jgi:hypothetical protein